MKKLLAIFLCALMVPALLPAAVAIYYPGGTVANTSITDDGTKQTLASGIEDCLNTAGWTTNSGHHLLPTTLTSGTGGDSNVGKVVMSAATNTVQFKIQNTSGSVAPAQAFGFLLPGTTTTWGCTANQFGFHVRSIAAGNLVPARSWVTVQITNTAPMATMAGGVPIIYGTGLAASDTDTAVSVQTWRSAGAAGAVSHNIVGAGPAWVGIAWGLSNSVADGSAPRGGAFTVIEGLGGATNVNKADYWSDAAGSVDFTDAVLMFSHSSVNHQVFKQGWMYGTVILNSEDCTLENKYTIDGHSFVCIGSTGQSSGTNKDDIVDTTHWGLLFLTCASGTSCVGT